MGKVAAVGEVEGHDPVVRLQHRRVRLCKERIETRQERRGEERRPWRNERVEGNSECEMKADARGRINPSVT